MRSFGAINAPPKASSSVSANAFGSRCGNHSTGATAPPPCAQIAATSEAVVATQTTRRYLHQRNEADVGAIGLGHQRHHCRRAGNEPHSAVEPGNTRRHASSQPSAALAAITAKTATKNKSQSERISVRIEGFKTRATMAPTVP